MQALVVQIPNGLHRSKGVLQANSGFYGPLLEAAAGALEAS